MKLKDNHQADFELYLETIGLKPITINKHVNYYRQFRDLFSGFITQGTVDSYLREKQSPNHRAMLTHLIELLKRDSNLDQEEMLEVSRLVVPKNKGRKGSSLIRIITKEELKRILSNVDLNNDLNTQRFKLMISWQYYSGLRISELCGLKMEDLGYSGRGKFFEDKRNELKYQKIHIRKELGKGNKEAWVFIPTDIYLGYFDFLKKWIQIDSNRASKVLSNEKTIWGLNKKKYSKLFKEEFFRILGWRLPFGKSTHILRHSRATHLLEEMGENKLLWVRDYMRHDSVKTTEGYLHLVKDRINKELNK